jgi:hypothetical protein
VIYCVVPRELEGELFEKLVDYYKDTPGVTVIVDRRRGGPDRRRAEADEEFVERRQTRDRRRTRIPGTFLPTDVTDA